MTFYEESDAMKCIQHVDGTPPDGRILRACFERQSIATRSSSINRATIQIACIYTT